MNPTQLKCLAVFTIFAITGFGPISPGCLIGLFLVVMRPSWFWELIVNMYANVAVPEPTPSSKQNILLIRIKFFLSLVSLAIIDIAPIPVTPIIAFAIILVRPTWFYNVVAKVYGETALLTSNGSPR